MICYASSTFRHNEINMEEMLQVGIIIIIIIIILFYLFFWRGEGGQGGGYNHGIILQFNPSWLCKICYIISVFLQGGIPAGQLTKVGQQQMYELGKKRGKLYVDNLKFLQETYHPEEI